MKRLASFACALSCASLCQAQPQPLDDAQLAQVRAFDGSIALGAPSRGSPGLSQAIAASSASATIDAPAFEQDMRRLGIDPAQLPGCEGQSVSRLTIDAPPASFSLAASWALTSKPLSGPSMGSFQINDFDARGTTIWSWPRR